MAARLCPSCGAAIDGQDAKCANCRMTLYRATAPKGLPKLPETQGRSPRKVPLNLPRYVSEARYCFGPTWTSGCLWIIPEGIFFLSEKDGFVTPESCGGLAPAPGVAKVGSLGFYAPEKSIEKFDHRSPLSSHTVITGRKVPLRLNADGWNAIVSYSALCGIAVE